MYYLYSISLEDIASVINNFLAFGSDPVVSVPCVYFIGLDGKPIQMLVGYHEAASYLSTLLSVTEVSYVIILHVDTCHGNGIRIRYLTDYLIDS